MARAFFYQNWSYLYERLGTLLDSKRAPRAIQIIRDEVIRHLKSFPEEEIYIDPSVNEKIWERGIENPPRKFNTVIRHDEPIFLLKLNCLRRPEHGKHPSKFYQNPRNSSC